MKRIFLILLLFVFCFGFAQKSGTITLTWNNNLVVSFGDFSHTIPNFNVDNFYFNESKKTIQYISKFDTDSEIDTNNFQISNLQYEAISENQLGELNKNLITSSINAKVSNSIARDLISAVLVFNPIIKEGTEYKKIISFSYSFSNASTNRLSQQNALPNAIVNSVLSSGSFKRFYVETSGVYKISKSFLDQIGFSTNGVDPRNIKIYGNGGRMVPLANATFYPNDLVQNNIQISGEQDGVFNNDDYILFYAEGMDNWSVENKTHLNLYENKSFYYITADGSSPGNRIPTAAPITASPTLTLSTYDGYYFHEVDLTNIGKLGRVWFGESFAVNNEQTFNFSIPNIDVTSPSQLSIHFGASAFLPTTFTTAVNGVGLGNSNLNQVQLNSGVEAAEQYLFSSLTSASNFSVKLTYNNSGLPTAKGCRRCAPRSSP